MSKQTTFIEAIGQEAFQSGMEILQLKTLGRSTIISIVLVPLAQE